MRAKINAIAASTWQVITIAVALVAIMSCSAFAGKAITKVDVANKADRTVICVQGNHPLSMVPIKSSAGRYLGFQFPFAMQAKGKIVGVYSGAIYCVKSSSYRSNPPASRIVVNTTRSLNYSTEWAADKKQVAITVWKYGCKPQATATEPKVTASATLPTTPAIPTLPALSREVMAPRVRLTDQNRNSSSPLVALASAPKTAYEMAASEPRVTTRVAGMVETRGTRVAQMRPAVVNKTPAPAAVTVTNNTQPETPSRKVSLNFLGADINDVLKALSVQSGQNIVASKDVKGNITVTLSDVTVDEALMYVARLSGYRYVKENDTYLVGVDQSLATLGGGAATGESLEIVRIECANPNDTLELVKGRVPGIKVSLFGLKGERSETTASKDNSGKMDTDEWKWSITNMRQPPTASMIILSGPADAIKAAKDLITQVESAARDTQESRRKWFSTRVKKPYTVKYVKPRELADTLMSLIPGLSIAYGATQEMNLPSANELMMSTSTLGKMQTAKKTDEETNAADKNKPEDNSALTNPTNSQVLVLVGLEADVEAALDLAKSLDVKAPLVNIEARVTSINKSAAKQLGINWDWSDFSFTETLDLVSLPPKDDGKPIEGFDPVTRPTRQYMRSPMTVNGVLDALATDGNAKVLASPNLLCLAGKPGAFFVGDEVTYIQRIETTATGQNVITDTKQVGVQLRVTPNVTEDGYVTLNLHPEVSTIKLSVDQGVTLPLVTRRFTDHIVRVKDGETIAIGGLIRNDEIKDMNKVPLLGDLPILGNFFKHISTSNSETEVVMFITAKLVKD